MAQVRVIGEAHGENFAAYFGDCCEITAQMPDSSVGFSVYSPPFSGLYIYNDSECDMGNSADDAEFLRHYSFFVKELFRVMKPGRNVAVHCKDLVYYKNQRGSAGLRDFPGMLIKAHTNAGFDFHSRITIWRSPVREMTKTKAHGLLYKQLRADASFSRQGLPEYFVVFRKWASREEEEAHSNYRQNIARIAEQNADLDDDAIDELINQIPVPVMKNAVTHTREDFPLDQWQEWASPVWMTTRETDVLQAKKVYGDEKHICPMPIDLTRRAITLWSNPGDVVFSPFMGIGSEGYVALKMKRKFVGTELKREYFQQAARTLAAEDATARTLFDAAE